MTDQNQEQETKRDTTSNTTAGARRRLSRWAGRACLVLGSFTLALLLLELAVRIFAPQQLVLFRPDIWIPVEGLGHQLAPNLDTTINTGERYVRLMTDTAGHRVGVSGRRPGSRFVLAVGDSFLEALQVEYEETMTALLERSLRESMGTDVVVMNTGVSGYNPNHYLAKVRQETAQLKFDFILVFVYVGNDIVDEKVERITPRRTGYKPLRMPHNLSQRELVDAWMYPLYRHLRSRSQLVVLLKRRFLGLWARIGLTKNEFPVVMLRTQAGSACWDTTLEILTQISIETAAAGTQTLYILIPPDFQVNKDLGYAFARGAGIDPKLVDLDQATRILEERLLDRGLPVLNAVRLLREAFDQGVDVHGKVDRHLNPEGHALIAENLYSLLRSHFVPPVKGAPTKP